MTYMIKHAENDSSTRVKNSAREISTVFGKLVGIFYVKCSILFQQMRTANIFSPYMYSTPL